MSKPVTHMTPTELSQAVARVAGVQLENGKIPADGYTIGDMMRNATSYTPASGNWSQLGPLIERFKLTIDFEPVNGDWLCSVNDGFIFYGASLPRVVCECIAEECGDGK